MKKRFFSLQWHITSKCDQACKHCYIYQSGNDEKYGKNELNFQNCKNIIEKFLQFCNIMQCNPAVSLTGGDPLLSPHFWDLASMLSKKKIPFSILGNPFHLSHEVCNRLKKLDCRSYQLSLDGLETTHDAMRKKGSFQETIKAISLLKQTKIKTNIMSTVSADNYQEIPHLTKIIVDQKIDTYAFARYCPTHKDTQYNIAPAEYRKFLEEMWNVFSKLADKGTFFNLKDHLWTLFLYEKGLIKIQPQKNIAGGCNCAVRHMTILADGTIYACRRFESPVGNIMEDSFENIFLGDKMNQYRNIDQLEGCKDCELLSYCRGCHAVAYGTFGSFFSKDPQCWKNEKTALLS